MYVKLDLSGDTMIPRLNSQFIQALYKAGILATKYGSNETQPEHILLALVTFECAAKRLVAKVIPPTKVKNILVGRITKSNPIYDPTIPSETTKQVMELATKASLDDQNDVIGTKYLLLGLTQIPSLAKDILAECGCTGASVHALMPSCSPS